MYIGNGGVKRGVNYIVTHCDSLLNKVLYCVINNLTLNTLQYKLYENEDIT